MDYFGHLGGIHGKISQKVENLTNFDFFINPLSTLGPKSITGERFQPLKASPWHPQTPQSDLDTLIINLSYLTPIFDRNDDFCSRPPQKVCFGAMIFFDLGIFHFFARKCGHCHKLLISQLLDQIEGRELHRCEEDEKLGQ